MYVATPDPGVTLKEAAEAQRRTLVGRGLGDYGDLGKGGLFRKIKKFKLGRFIGRTALPIAAGGLALKFGPGLVKKAAKGLFRKRAGPSTTTLTAAGPVVTPAAEAAAPSVADTIAQTAATLATSALTKSAEPSAFEIPGATPSAAKDTAAAQEGTAAGGGFTEAGMLGGGSSKTLLLLAAVGAGAFLLSKSGRR
jgi:hypothetical protein